MENGSCRDNELENILLPVFVHMCIDLVLNGQRSIGKVNNTVYVHLFHLILLEKYIDFHYTFTKQQILYMYKSCALARDIKCVPLL